ncbi:hypothetical protein pipiens_017550 [Culex pipiens pipiens]|uniref:RRM domain-containing protein n=1 Tax=Culex pipiens pipiens TaxID=38569 RepID=A0ABD1CH65_CULPP
MSSGKKGKKTSKKSTISLGEFLTDGNAALASQVQVAVPVKPRDWADECDDDDDDRPMRTQMIALPTAPRATRLLNDDTVPQNGPFQAYMSNLPYDLNEEDVYVFFDGMDIVSLRLPRDDSESGRLRGFGYVEFGKRQDLIDALSIPEPMLNGRRIRIDFSSEGDRNRNQRNNRYNNDNYGGDSDRPMGNWRDAPRIERDQGQRRPYNSYNRGDRDGGERGGDSERGSRYGSSEGGAGGNWRLGDRPAQAAPSSPPSSRRGFDRGGAERVGDRGGFRRGPDRSGERGGRREMEPPMERPKLVLQPRTLPLPEKPKPESEPEGSERDVSPDPKSQEDKENEEQAEPRPKPTPVPAAKLFGDAKPVDTAAKLREIEERLQEKERQRKAAVAEAAAAAAASAAEEDEGKEKSDPSKDEAGDEHSEGTTTAKKEEVISNWRVRSEPSDQKDRAQSPSRRYTKRNDDYSNFSDNRDRDNRDRRDNRNMRDNRRDFNRPNDRADRGGDRGGFRAGDRDQRDRRPDGPRADDREHAAKPSEAKPIEERMPKFQEPTGPNLSMQNTFEGLSADEVDD